MSEVKTKPMRERMPQTAEIADFFRTWLGKDLVDKQIARATQARREYEALHRAEGRQAAEDWRRLNWREATFYARENGESLGMPDATPEENAVTPNIDPRILRAAIEGGPIEAKRVEAMIANWTPPGKRKVQTSALRGDQ